MRKLLPVLLILALLAPASAVLACSTSSCSGCCCAQTMDHCRETGSEGLDSSRCSCDGGELPATAPSGDAAASLTSPEQVAVLVDLDEADSVGREHARGDGSIGAEATGATTPLYVLVCSFIS